MQGLTISLNTARCLGKTASVTRRQGLEQVLPSMPCLSRADC